MRIKEVKLYKFDELSDEAKEKAREWYRDGALDYEWWNPIYEDAENIGFKITGFDLDRNRHAKGKLLWSAEDVANKIIAEHGESCETYKDAKNYLVELTALQAKIGEDEDIDTEDIDEEFLKSLLEDYSIMLQHEYEYLLSDESVDDMIIANEYEFTESGKRCC